MRPLIGITTYLTRARFGAWEEDSALVPADYVRAVERAGAPRPLFFRPPLGWSGATVGAVAWASHLRTIPWNVAVEHYVDHAGEVSPSGVCCGQSGPDRSCSPTTEAGPDRSRTIALLPQLLEQLHERGYRVTTPSALLSTGTAQAARD